MFLVKVLFEQNGVWSKPYTYLSTEECRDHVVVPTHNYMSVAFVQSCIPLPENTKTEGLKYVYGRVNFEFLS